MKFLIIEDLIRKLELTFSKQEIVKILIDINQSMSASPMVFINELKNTTYDYALQYEICSNCGEKLKRSSTEDWRSILLCGHCGEEYC